MTYKQILLCVTFLFLMVGATKADLYEDAVEAAFNGEYQRAALLFEMLAEKGDPKAQVMLGAMYHSGRGVKKDSLTGAMWFLLAAAQGSPVAQGELGRFYMLGEGVPQNFKIGLRYLLQAAEGGFPPAMGYLGVAYAKGWGTPINYLKAYMWTNLSLISFQALGKNHEDDPSNTHYETVLKMRSMLLGMLSSDQIDKAQQLSMECLRNEFRNC